MFRSFPPYARENSFWKTGTLYIAILLIISAGAFFLIPQRAEALATCAKIPVPPATTGVFVPVLDSANLVQNTTAASHLSSIYSKECVQDTFVNFLVKTTIRKFTNDIVRWINSGFEGNPAFVTDPAGFALGVGDRVAGEFISRSSLGFLCDPFRLNVQLGLAMQYRRFIDRGCSLSDVLNNVRGFIDDGDFESGGWNTWLAVTQREGGNPYDAYLRASSRLAVEISGAQGLELAKLSWGRGFLSWEECRYYDYQGGEVNGDDPNIYGEDCQIQTPGSVIESQLENQLGSSLKQLELADEFDEIIGALVNQLLVQVFNSAGGLRGR